MDVDPTERKQRRRNAGLLTTGEMARRAGSTLRTVRFYEEEGFIRPADRSRGGHRLFVETELDRLLFVTDLRATGLCLEDIRAVLELKDNAATPEEAATRVTGFLEARLAEMRRQMELLGRLTDEFAASKAILDRCKACPEPSRFPVDCASCANMCGNLPRAVRLLWGDAPRNLAARPLGSLGSHRPR